MKRSIHKIEKKNGKIWIMAKLFIVRFLRLAKKRLGFSKKRLDV